MGAGDLNDMLPEEIEKKLQKRPRSVTLLNLKWLADRIRRACQIRKDIEEGSYTVDSKKVAQSLLNIEES